MMFLAQGQTGERGHTGEPGAKGDKGDIGLRGPLVSIKELYHRNVGLQDYYKCCGFRGQLGRREIKETPGLRTIW